METSKQSQQVLSFEEFKECFKELPELQPYLAQMYEDLCNVASGSTDYLLNMFQMGEVLDLEHIAEALYVLRHYEDSTLKIDWGNKERGKQPAVQVPLTGRLCTALQQEFFDHYEQYVGLPNVSPIPEGEDFNTELRQKQAKELRQLMKFITEKTKDMRKSAMHKKHKNEEMHTFFRMYETLDAPVKKTDGDLLQSLAQVFKKIGWMNDVSRRSGWYADEMYLRRIIKEG